MLHMYYSVHKGIKKHEKSYCSVTQHVIFYLHSSKQPSSENA